MGEKAKPSAALVERIEKKRRDLAAAEQAEKARSMETMASMAGAAFDVLGGLFAKRKSLKVGKVGSVLSKRRMEGAAETKIETLKAELEELEAEGRRARPRPLRKGRGHPDEDRSRHPRRRGRLGELTGGPRVPALSRAKERCSLSADRHALARSRLGSGGSQDLGQRLCHPRHVLVGEAEMERQRDHRLACELGLRAGTRAGRRTSR